MVYAWLAVLPVAVAPSPKSHWKDEMEPVEEVPLKSTVTGAVPVRGAAVITAFKVVVSVGSVVEESLV